MIQILVLETRVVAQHRLINDAFFAQRFVDAIVGVSVQGLFPPVARVDVIRQDAIARDLQVHITVEIPWRELGTGAHRVDAPGILQMYETVAGMDS